MNLLINAVQAIEGREAGELAVSIEVDAIGAAAFVLRDNGPGIPPEHLERIFDGFFTTKEHGMGIGLAICRSIVAAHGGTVSAANRSEGGAVFRVTLPPATHRDMPQRPSGDPQPWADAGWRRQRSPSGET